MTAGLLGSVRVIVQLLDRPWRCRAAGSLKRSTLIASKNDLSLKLAAVGYVQEIFRVYLKMFNHLQRFRSGGCYFWGHGWMWKETVMACFVLISLHLYGVIKVKQ